MKFLITGFDPFGGESLNPAWEAVKKIPALIGSSEIVTTMLPTVFGDSISVLLDSIKKHNPDVVVCVGQAGGRYDITIERIGININDARISDNKGNQPVDTPIYEDGENAYFSNLPIKRITSALQERGIPSTVSNTAGTFVCNHILYALLYHIAKGEFSARYGGFIHVPFIPSQVVKKPNSPSMSLSMITEGLTYAIEAMDLSMEDQKISSGKEF